MSRNCYSLYEYNMYNHIWVKRKKVKMVGTGTPKNVVLNINLKTWFWVMQKRLLGRVTLSG